MRFYLGYIVLFLLLTACEEPVSSESTDVFDSDYCSSISVSYKNDISPILDIKCNTSSCHANGFVAGDFTTHEGLQEKINEGTFHERVVIKGDMPTTSSGLMLSDSQIKMIDCWLHEGGQNN